MRRFLPMIAAASIAASVPALANPPNAVQELPTVVVQASGPTLPHKLMELAKRDLENGDITSARLRLVSPVQAGLAEAIRMYAETMDPKWLLAHLVFGANFANPEESVTLYSYAANLGDKDAAARMAELSADEDTTGCKKVEARK